jgi:outer membrane protein assembly factor BamB
VLLQHLGRNDRAVNGAVGIHRHTFSSRSDHRKAKIILPSWHFGDGSLLVAKFDPDGTLIWQRTWGDNGNFPNGIAVTAEGVYVTGGTSTFDGGQSDAILI